MIVKTSRRFVASSNAHPVIGTSSNCHDIYCENVVASSTYIKARTRLRIHFSRFSRSALSYSLCVLSTITNLLANLACFCKHRNKQIHTHTRHFNFSTLQRNPKILISRYLLISRYFCVSLPVLLLIRLIAMFFI